MELKETLNEESTTKIGVSPEFPNVANDEDKKQKLLNIMEVTSKTLSNAVSMEEKLNKFIQTKNFDEQTSQFTNQTKLTNLNLKNKSNINFQDQSPSPKKQVKKLMPIHYDFKDYEQEI